MRALFVTRQFERDFLSVPPALAAQAELIIPIIRERPTDPALNTKKLKGIKPSLYRVRLGAYRLIYSFTKTTLVLHRFRHRKDIYSRL